MSWCRMKNRSLFFIVGVLVFLLLQTGVYALHVSVYYYPWYGGISNSSVLRNRLVPSQPPELGSYSSSDTKVISQHIAWCETYGIDTWVTSWWGAGKQTDDVTKNNIAPLLNKSKVTYCLFFESTGLVGFGDISDGDIDKMRSSAAYMVQNHFSNSSYYKIDGKPVLFIYVSRDLTGNFAGGLQAMRDEATNGGFPGLYIVGDEDYWGTLNPDRARLYDAVSPYNMHGPQKYAGYASTTGLLDDIKAQFLKDKKIANSVGTKLFPNCSPGFNDRAVRLSMDHYPIPRRVHPDSSHTSTFSHYFDVALATMEDQLPAIVINSWNEWMEDSQIEPVKRTGSTKNDNDGNKFTLGYEYVGYGDDFLKVIRMKRDADSLSRVAVKVKNVKLNRSLFQFSVSSAKGLVVLRVDFPVEYARIFNLHGKLIGSHRVTNNQLDLNQNQGHAQFLKNGVHVLQLEGGGKKHTCTF